MALVDERPSVLERLGSAMHSSNLGSAEGKIGAVDLIAALAYTQLNPDASEHAEHEAIQIDPRTELAAVLVRLKYAGDQTLGDRGAQLLEEWVRHQKAFGRWKLSSGRRDLLGLFVRQALAEWLFPVCQTCNGQEMLGMDRGEIVERRVRCTLCKGAGVLAVTRKSKTGGPGWCLTQQCWRCGGGGWSTRRRVRQGKPRVCDSCLGTGQHRANDAERVRVLGVELSTYHRRWAGRFLWLAAGLDRLDWLVRRCLQTQMKLL